MRRYPGKKLCRENLRRLYKKHRIKRKCIKITKVQPHQIQLKIKREVLMAADQLKHYMSRGFRVIYFDETMVTKRTLFKQDYCQKNEYV
jgi:hypothetical protein